MEVMRNMTIDTELFELGDIISFTLTTGEKVKATVLRATTTLPLLLAFARSFSYPKISPPCGASSIKNGGECRADKM